MSLKKRKCEIALETGPERISIDLPEGQICESRPRGAPEERWRWGKIIFAVTILTIAGTIGALIPFIAESIASLLVAKDTGAFTGQPVWVVLTANHRRVPETYDRVADLVRQFRAERVLIFARPVSRVEELGIVPSPEKLAVDELERRGIDRELLRVHSAAVFDPWDEIRQLAVMMDHKAVRMIYCVGRFDSRAISGVVRRLVEPEKCALIWIRGLPDPRFDETNWWKSRAGWKALFAGYMGLAQAWLFGEPRKLRLKSVDEYEQWAAAILFGESSLAKPAEESDRKADWAAHRN